MDCLLLLFARRVCEKLLPVVIAQEHFGSFFEVVDTNFELQFGIRTCAVFYEVRLIHSKCSLFLFTRSEMIKSV